MTHTIIKPKPTSKVRKWLPAILFGLFAGTLIAVLIIMSNGSKNENYDPLADADESPAEMVEIPAGSYLMGSNSGAPDEQPIHEVSIKSFMMDKTEVTNGQYAAFVKATGYVTIAERKPDIKKYPTADPNLLVPGSAVFVPVHAPLNGPWETAHPPWWKYVPGANWKHPEGPKSSIQGRMNYPVVQIAWEDADAYCKWAQKRLPTEAEWEYAARGGLAQHPFVWGNTKPGEENKWYANTFQGEFPTGDTGEDGFKGISPVAQFPPNGFGLHDASGNVWEWCNDFYDPDYYAKSPKNNPPGPEVGKFEGNQPLRVRRGGSFLCADAYCRRYVPNARDSNPTDSGACHTGFRCVKDK